MSIILILKPFIVSGEILYLDHSSEHQIREIDYKNMSQSTFVYKDPEEIDGEHYYSYDVFEDPVSVLYENLDSRPLRIQLLKEFLSIYVEEQRIRKRTRCSNDLMVGVVTMEIMLYSHVIGYIHHLLDECKHSLDKEFKVAHNGTWTHDSFLIKHTNNQLVATHINNIHRVLNRKFHDSGSDFKPLTVKHLKSPDRLL